MIKEDISCEFIMHMGDDTLAAHVPTVWSAMEQP